MWKIIRLLIFIIWLIDILNINFIIDGVAVAEFLDKTLPLNFWFWFLYMLIAPDADLEEKIC